MRHLIFIGWTIVAVLVGAGFLHLLPKLGSTGKRLSESLCRAPGLDWVITYFTILPMFVGPVLLGWKGFFDGVAGQVAGMLLWQFAHEALNREAMRGPRILKVTNAKVGALPNCLATWLTAFATPIFWFIRLCTVFVYTPLTWLVGLPAYQGSEWVAVSRQKFAGLVGHDLIWCLYCDWMTGVWSLATEMLRNVESFWCPIKFYSDKKCDNCKIDFPDVVNGWTDPAGTMADVTRLHDEKYPFGQKVNAWFGHPVRLTVKGESPNTPATIVAPGEHAE